LGAKNAKVFKILRAFRSFRVFRVQRTKRAEQKILFFYDWPELARLRDEIISRVCTYFNQP
jgi:hypothetical protein